MKLTINNFMGIDTIKFDDSSNLIVLVGDNGVGKTFFLETYTLIADEIQRLLTPKNPDLIKVLDYFNFSKSLDFNILKIENSLDIPVNKNNSEIKKQLEQFILNFTSEIENKIEKLVLCIKEEDTTEHINIDFNIKVDTLYTAIENIKSITLKKDKQLEEYSCYINNKQYILPDIDAVSNSADIFNLQVEEHIQESILNYIIEYFDLLPEHKNIEPVIFFPSERNSDVIGDFMEAIDIEKGLPVRYSEYKFAKNYSNFKRIEKLLQKHPTLVADFDEVSSPLATLLEGTPVMDREGEIKGILDNSGNLIEKKLFSTKQNKVTPLMMMDFVLNLSNTFIIEEPEAHLSLKGLNDMRDYIMYCLNNSKKIILSTHSDIFFTKLNSGLLNFPNITADAYEILYDQNSNEKLFKKIEKNKFGFLSNFIKTELQSNYNEIVSAQKNILSTDQQGEN